MPEPLKNLYTTKLVESLTERIKEIYIEFDSEGFKNSIFDTQWESRSLKERMSHIAEILQKYLPDNYSEAIDILKPVSTYFSGFEYMFFPYFVELYGIGKFKESIDALEHFTKYSSSEFAVRPFIMKYENRMMMQMEKWAESNDQDVRRLASEGCRPRLPWAMALPKFKNNPQAVITILEKLMHDKSEYVRRSVANNLNDISKDNPQCVIGIAKAWIEKTANTDKLIKHGCRTLLKQGNSEILNLFGFEEANHIVINNFYSQDSVAIGEKLFFSFVLESTKEKLGKIRIEYAIDFMKKNGLKSRKIFKISESNNDKKIKKVEKNHSFKVITTRSYYSGEHCLTIILNGVNKVSVKFNVRVEKNN